MKPNGASYTPVIDEYDLQGELDNTISDVKDIVNDIDDDGNTENKKEILKGIINYLVE